MQWKGSDVSVDDHVRVRFDRGSVAAGDDTVSHEEYWAYPVDATIDDLLLDTSRSVPAAAGWSVRVVGGKFDGDVLGILYFSTDPDTRVVSCSICRLRAPRTTLTSLSGEYGLDVYAYYMSSGDHRPVDRDELIADSARAYRAADRVWAAERESSSWRTVAEIRRQDKEIRVLRRAWLREVLVAVPDPPGADEFVAAAMTTMAAEVCPASIALTAEILGIDGAGRDIGIHAIAPCVPSPRRAILAMVFGAFEFTIASGSWEHGEAADLRVYLDQLERWGWRLLPPELVMAGRISVSQLVTGS